MPDTSSGTFVSRQIESGGKSYRYQVFVPAAALRHGRTPVVLFLHGSGERGSDGALQTQAGLGPYLRSHADSFPAIVVFPQSPLERSWDGDIAQMAFDTLDAATGEFNGDPQRTYLTGMSRGGYGTWQMALMQPRRFAALAPVCGGITQPNVDTPLVVDAVAASPDPFAAAAAGLKHIPTWIFHGGKDDVVPPQQSQRMYAAMQAAGADVHYTEWPQANHNSWDLTYADPQLWQWMWQQQRQP